MTCWKRRSFANFDYRKMAACTKDGDKIITRGDANNSEDKPVEEKMIIGVVIKVIPKLGTWQQILSSPEVLTLIIILILILSAIYMYTSKTEEKNEK